MSACRSCGAEIIWVVAAASGKRMPIDAEPVAGGNLVLNGDQVVYVEPTDAARYISHFVTCPQSAEWRKPK